MYAVRTLKLEGRGEKFPITQSCLYSHPAHASLMLANKPSWASPKMGRAFLLELASRCPNRSIVLPTYPQCELVISCLLLSTASMNLLKKFGDLVSPNDPELIEKTLVWMEQQNQWNDVFSTKLIELLDGMEGARNELRTGARDAETVAERSRLGLEKRAAEFQKNLRGEVRKAIQTVESQAQRAKQDLIAASRDLANVKLAHSQAEKSL